MLFCFLLGVLNDLLFINYKNYLEYYNEFKVISLYNNSMQSEEKIPAETVAGCFISIKKGIFSL